MADPNHGDLALFLNLRDDKRYLVQLKSGGQLHTHRGIIAHDAVIGQPWGRIVRTQMGTSFLVVEPSTADLVRHIKRSTQILFPKDVGYLMLKLSVRPGRLILEAGTGSGGMTLAMALATAPLGRVVSYEVRPEFQALAMRNLERANIPPGVVEFKLRDIAQGFDETAADAFFATLVPTMNQVIPTVQALEGGPFGLLEVEELLLRPYKAVSSRVRPADRMVAHTGYLIFARKVESVQPRPTEQAAGAVQPAGEEADTAETEPDEQPD